MVKKIGYKTPSIIALTIAGTAISAHHADAAENTTQPTQPTPNKVIDSQKALQQAEKAKAATTSQQTTVSGTKAYQDPTKVSTNSTTSTTPTQSKQVTSTAAKASTQTSTAQPKSDSHIQLHNEAQVSPEAYAQANRTTATQSTAQTNTTQSTQASAQTQHTQSSQVSSQNNTNTSQSLSAQPKTYSVQTNTTDINANPNGPTPPRIGGKGGPATLSLNSNATSGTTALRANAAAAYKPKVASKINDYIRKQNYTVPKYEEDFSSYFPKYGYRNGVGKPEGIVVHDTANPNSTIEGEISYMKRNYQSAFVHGFINDQRIIETQPTDYLSWGAGPNANERFINIELVHVYGYDKFARQMNNFADYAATNLQYYNLRPDSAEYDGQGTVWTHDAVSRFLGGTDHTDPHGYLASRGYSYNELYDLINEKYMIKMGLASPAYTPGGSTPSTPSTPDTKPSSPLSVTNDTGVGRINTSNSGLYTTVYDNAGKKTSATNQTLNVTKKASLNGNNFYLVSDYNTGTHLGWVKQTDVDYRTSQPAVKISKNFTIPAGTTLYSVPWGTSVQVAGAVKGTGAQAFKATQQIVQAVSQIGQLKPTNSGVRATIYDQTGKDASSHADRTYKITKTASANNQNFVLLQNANNTPLGWFKTEDVLSRQLGKEVPAAGQYVVNTNATGLYAMPWGTAKQRIDTLKALTNRTFNATKSVLVGKDTYLFGNINQKMGWINKNELTAKAVAQPKPTPTQIKTLTKPVDYVVYNRNGQYFTNVGDAKAKGYLSSYYESLFNVQRSALVNGVTWYYGQFNDGTRAWIKSADLRSQLTRYINSPYTFNQAVDIQSNLSYKPQIQRVPGQWVDATRAEVANAMNPSTIEKDPTQKYQFLKLDKYQGLDAAQLNKLLVGKGILAGQGQAFKQAAQANNINEIYLISHALLETGNGTSTLANGGYVDANNKVVTNSTRKFYNMFGIGAVDTDAIRGGFKTAEAYGWNTVSKAIVGGASFIKNRYIGIGQNTLYRMRWNPENPGTHQYATDINWAHHNAARMKQFYDAVGAAGKYFDVDRYKK